MIDFSVGSSGFFTQNITVLYNGHIDTATGTIYQSSQVLEYVSQIVLSEDETAETTYVYEYDENGNITVITDENEISQRKYYYDGLGQLVREDNRALGKTYIWTYDNAGNIKSKKTYAFTTGTCTELGIVLYSST